MFQYKIFTLINLIVSLVSVILVFILSAGDISSVAFSAILFAVVFGLNLVSKDSLLKISLVSQRIVLLVTFIVAVLVSFTPYIFSYSENTNMVYLVFVASTLLLLNILLLKGDTIKDSETEAVEALE